jgi:hypothetical protein
VSHAVSEVEYPLIASLLSATVIALGGWALHRVHKRAGDRESDDSAPVDLRTTPSPTPEDSPSAREPQKANRTEKGADSTS